MQYLLDIFCCRICCYIDAKADGHEKQEFQAQKAAEPRQGLWGFFLIMIINIRNINIFIVKRN